jgi:predicted alpha-1,2-mannosidase
MTAHLDQIAPPVKSGLGRTVRVFSLIVLGIYAGSFQLTAAAAVVSGVSPIPESQLNGTAKLVNGAIQLVDGGQNENGSAFYKKRVTVSKFSTHFTVQLNNATADGFTFCLQNNLPTALGAPGQGSNLGFSEIGHSIAVAFDVYGGGSLVPTTSFIADGSVSAFWQSSFLHSGVDLLAGHQVNVDVYYDGKTLTAIETDPAIGKSVRQDYTINLVSLIGSSSAYPGFTGADGLLTSVQQIVAWTWDTTPQNAPALPTKPLTAWADPFVGTANGGDTFPGAVLPFGMTQATPIDDVKQIGGYDENSPTTLNALAMNQLNGPGISDYGDVWFTATTGTFSDPTKYTSAFSTAGESASPGYYQVFLKSWNTNVEVTSTLHASLAKFTFPAGTAANVVVPISQTATQSSQSAEVQVKGNNELDGYVVAGNWGSNVKVYFCMQFDQPFTTSGTWTKGTLTPGSTDAKQSDSSTQVGAYVTFPQTNASQVVQARIGISYVDVNGARNNVTKEIPKFDFNAVLNQAQATWEKELGKLQATSNGFDDDYTVFYTALYHVLLGPTTWNDLDGRYVGYDQKIHTVPSGHKTIYANISGWDIYRTQIPLLTLIEPQRCEDLAESIVEMYNQLGYMDRWPFANFATGVMNGYPMTIILSEIWNAGLHNFDINTAYKAMWQDATNGDAQVIKTIGWLSDPSTMEEDCESYAALATVADSLGKTADASALRKLATKFVNIYNPANGYLEPRYSNGSWRADFNPSLMEANYSDGYVEGSAWQYLWLVPQDEAGLIKLEGGAALFNQKLDQFFSDPTLQFNFEGSYYNAYNEPDLQAPFLYIYSGAPWKTQSLVRNLELAVYNTTTAGIPGNDDLGTMSAWYVLSALGIYKVDPSLPYFELTSPLFPKVVLNLESPYPGSQFVFEAPNNSATNVYINEVTLDGVSLAKPWITENQITGGGTMNVSLRSSPNTKWGLATPPSISTGVPMLTTVVAQGTK